MPNTSANKRTDFRLLAAISKCWVRPESGQLPINQTKSAEAVIHPSLVGDRLAVHRSQDRVV